jgi:hypothetical protein
VGAQKTRMSIEMNTVNTVLGEFQKKLKTLLGMEGRKE